MTGFSIPLRTRAGVTIPQEGTVKFFGRRCTIQPRPESGPLSRSLPHDTTVQDSGRYPVEDVPEDVRASCQEIFGPVVCLKRVGSFEEALRLANGSVFGLQAGVFTNDLGRAFEAFGVLEVGSVNINEVPSMRLDAMPYGGVKQSGLGREGPREAMLEMTEPRQMLLSWL